MSVSGIYVILDESVDIQGALKEIGIHDIFFEADQTAKTVLSKDIPRVINNRFMCNGSELKIYSEPLTGYELRMVNNNMFGVYDSDALNIISAISVTSELQKRIVDTHVKDLKEINLIQTNFVNFTTPASSVIKALYGFVGDTFDSLKYNWIDPQDADGSHRLELLDGAATRVIPNGINFEGSFCLDTNFNPSTELTNDNSFSFCSIYNFSDEGDLRLDMGNVAEGGGYKGIQLTIRRDETPNTVFEDTYQDPSVGVDYDEIDSKGYYLANKVSDALRVYKDGSQKGTTSDSGASEYVNGNIVLGGAYEDGGLDDTIYSRLPCGYAHIGEDLLVAAIVELHFAIKRLITSKSDYYFPPDETEQV